MPSRSDRARIAAETVAVVTAGHYTAPSGATISIADAVQRSIEKTELIKPGKHDSLRAKADAILSDRNFAPVIEVTNETTFAAARRLVSRFGSDQVAALNFASAKNPGGGFLGGSQAQEESLSRASALYACISTQTEYYEVNRATKSSLYTDHMIVSPAVPVIRDDDDRLLEDPWHVTIITSPAPNAGAIAQNDPPELERVEPTFRRRIEQVLSAAVAFDHTAVVLGAWGCGVFRNDPAMVARRFGEFLLPGGAFARAFTHISFAVLDRQGDTLAAFANVFGSVKT
jgi:uncharacterized protein (TIGR02452 family)